MEEKTCPVIIDGEIFGSLEVRREGCFTVFSVKTRPREGITRISAYGDGKEGYLGVLMPEGNGLALRRAFSRYALRAFPENIVCAGLSFLGEPRLKSEETAEPEPDEPFPDGIDWYRTPDGALFAFSGERSLVAFPKNDERARAAGRGIERTVEGKTYMVYAVEDGRAAPL